MAHDSAILVWSAPQPIDFSAKTLPYYRPIKKKCNTRHGILAEKAHKAPQKSVTNPCENRFHLARPPQIREKTLG
jgi:hypothetical protein